MESLYDLAQRVQGLEVTNCDLQLLFIPQRH